MCNGFTAAVALRILHSRRYLLFFVKLSDLHFVSKCQAAITVGDFDVLPTAGAVGKQLPSGDCAPEALEELNERVFELRVELQNGLSDAEINIASLQRAVRHYECFSWVCHALTNIGAE